RPAAVELPAGRRRHRRQPVAGTCLGARLPDRRSAGRLASGHRRRTGHGGHARPRRAQRAGLARRRLVPARGHGVLAAGPLRAPRRPRGLGRGHAVRLAVRLTARAGGVRCATCMLIAFNKPYGVLCQFTDRSTPPRPTLAGFGLPAGVYPAGRLDFDSEGLLLLTDDGALAHRLTDPRHKQPKTYWVQVEGDPDDARLQPLRDGVVLNDGATRPATVRRIEPPRLWPRDPPVRFRKT